MNNLRPLFSRIKYFVLWYFVEPYFCFWSFVYLRRWRPKIIVITGSVGKTSLLHFLNFQLGNLCDYSHKANTKIGISLHLLNLPVPRSGQRWRWFTLPLILPFRALLYPPRKAKYYLAEYDVANLLATYFFKLWLRPHICLWLSLSPAHLEFFDQSSRKTGHDSFDLLAQEFAKIAFSASEKIFAPAENKKMRLHLEDCPTSVKWVKNNLSDYSVRPGGTVFTFPRRSFKFKQPVPEAMSGSLVLGQALLDYLKIKPKTEVVWEIPPGRMTLLEGYKGCYLIDSTYNAQFESIEAVFAMLKALEFEGRKWLVCGDMIEQGKTTAAFHRELAKVIAQSGFDDIFLIGSRLGKFTYPLLKERGLPVFWQEKVDLNFLNHLKQVITGREIILFKGAGFLDTIVEALLQDEADRKLLNEPGRNSHLLKS